MTPKKVRPLSARQQAFVEAYLTDLNASTAYQKAYKVPMSSAGTAGARLLKSVRIATVINTLVQKRSDKTGVTAERVVQELAALGFADVRKAFTWDAQQTAFIPSTDIDDDTARAIQSVKSRTRFMPNGPGKEPTRVVELELKMHAKEPALNLIARHLGMLKDPVAEALTALAESMRAARERAAKR